MARPDVTRWPGGVNDATEDGAYSRFAGLRPFRYYTWINDFDRYVSTDWVLTETDAGSTEAIVSGTGGILAITNVSAGATDEASIQWAGGAGAVRPTFAWDSTKDMLLAARFKLSDATNAACLIGIASTDTTPVASLPTNGIYFYKAGGATSLIASARKAGTSTSVTLGAMADDTYVDVVFRFDSNTETWQAFLNNAMIGSFSTSSVSPTAALAVTIGLLNASAAAHVLSVDWLQISQQR